ncbi:MAG: flagellar biosynthesis protein FlhB [Planctomycetota bacterium]|nr:flagellar biosynthesis protein FlhB [Planctomycetota bacterium]
MAEDQAEKTETATPRRQLEARMEGNIARSPDLAAAATLLAGILLLQSFGLGVFRGLWAMLETMLAPGFSANPTRADDIGQLLYFSMRMIATAAGPMVIGVAVVAFVVSLSQVGLVFTTKPLEFNFGKLSPLRGLKGLFDTRAGFRTVMSVGKLAIVGTVAFSLVAAEMPKIIRLAELAPLALFVSACDLIYTLALRLALLLLFMALVDYGYQRWQHDRDLRMTKQEVKEEMRSMEGDPLIKQRRMRVARQLAMQRIGQSVPRADVVVTNPTHFAVALQYDSKTMTSPKVVAKGADFLAMRIRQLATANGVPLVERKALAQALYKNVEVGQEVPPQFYGAVAEILAYVYRLSGRKSA